MGLRGDITAYRAARTRRLIPAAALAYGLALGIVLARRAAGPNVDRLVWVALLAALMLGFMAFAFWDFHWQPRARGHRCPRCRQPLVAKAEQAVIETGRCTTCDAEIA